MKLTVIGSGSSGNCYALYSDSGRILLLDCGMPIKEVKRAIDWNMLSVDGCVVTHGHTDHINARTYEELYMSGIRIERPYLDDEAINAYIMGDFTVHVFELPHDGVANRGMMIRCDNQTLLYITDAEYVRYNFKKFNVDHIICECNYQEKFVDLESENSAHIFRGHMSLGTCMDFLRANYTDNLKTIVLCHMSKVNADPVECFSTVLKTFPDTKVYVADKGLEIDL